MPAVGRSRLEDVTKTLVDSAMGRVKADLVVRGGSLVNVFTGEILEGVDVAVKGDRIALVGRADHTIGPDTQVIDASGKYVVPGFIDGHVHIESSMLTVTGFARAVLPHGTTAVFADPHEIANVLGLNGVRLLLEESRGVPLKVFITLPSCVPATSPEFETAGAEITPRDVEEAMGWEGVIALGEVMNYPGVLAGDDKMHGEIAATLRAGKVVEGHFYGNLEEELSAYAAAGVSSCHESTTKEAGLAKARVGIYTMIREGSAWRDLSEVIRAVTETRIDTRRFCLVSDDRHPEHLISEGHMDHIVRRAIEEGLDPITAIQMATLNTAEHFRVDQDLGAVAPGRYADILLLSSLSRVEVDTVIADGRVVAREGRLTVEIPTPEYPDFAKNTVRLPRPVEPGDFEVSAPVLEGTARTRVIQVQEASVLTKEVIMDVPVSAGKARADPEADLAKVAVIERHRGTGRGSVGFVTGFGFRRGAVASTVAHDSHNLLVMGVSDEDMARAANVLREVGGGMVVVADGEVLGLVELPIAGLLSDEPVERVAEEVRRLAEAWRALGCEMVYPFMTMALLALPVIPELRITDKGLIDVNSFSKVDLFVSSPLG